MAKKTTKTQYAQALLEINHPAVAGMTLAQVMRTYSYGQLWDLAMGWEEE